MTATVTTPTDLLGLADAILDGSITVPGASATRGAAVIARQVLEETVERRCQELAGITARPTFRSQLVLLRELGDPVVAERARVAWEAQPGVSSPLVRAAAYRYRSTLPHPESQGSRREPAMTTIRLFCRSCGCPTG